MNEHVIRILAIRVTILILTEDAADGVVEGVDWVLGVDWVVDEVDSIVEGVDRVLGGVGGVIGSV